MDTTRKKQNKRGLRNPAGAKLLRQWYKFKIGARGTYEEALAWYSKINAGVTR